MAPGATRGGDTISTHCSRMRYPAIKSEATSEDGDSAYSSTLDDSEQIFVRASQSPNESTASMLFGLDGMSGPGGPGGIGAIGGTGQAEAMMRKARPAGFSASQTQHFIPAAVQSDNEEVPVAQDPALLVKAFMDANRGVTDSALLIKVLGVPLQHAKSRVETQIKLCIQLVTTKGEKVPLWSHLRLPEHLATREKARRSKFGGIDSIPPKDVLELEAVVVCSSDPTKIASTCSGCINRERKRIRKKETGKRSASGVSPDRDVVMGGGLEDEYDEEVEKSKVILFNCAPVVDFSSGDTILPSRITCYCRHHNEKQGFWDHNQKVIATGISPPILITDDHKSNRSKAGQKRQRTDEPDGEAAILESRPTAVAVTKKKPSSVMRDETPSMTASPMQQHSQDSIDLPNLDFYTTLNASLDPSAIDSNGYFHFSPNPFKRPHLDPIGTLADTLLTSLDSSTPTSSSAPAVTTPPKPTPIIGRVIPAEGPMRGGTEITVLGQGFYPGLTCQFGDSPAAVCSLWGTTTMVCVLPPSSIPGPVPVTFREHAEMSFAPVNEIAIFTYRDDSERALMELALQVVGLRMTGKLEDARHVAMRIVTDTAKDESHEGGGGAAGVEFNMAHLFLKLSAMGPAARASVEHFILTALMSVEDLADFPAFTLELDLPLKDSRQTLLHLSCFAGMTTLAKYLIAMGAELDARDINGFTPLHYATWAGEKGVTLELLRAGASPFLTSKQNISAWSIAKKSGFPEIRKSLEFAILSPIDDYESDIADEDDSEIEFSSEEEEGLEELEVEVAREALKDEASPATVSESHIHEAAPVFAARRDASVPFATTAPSRKSLLTTAPSLPADTKTLDVQASDLSEKKALLAASPSLKPPPTWFKFTAQTLPIIAFPATLPNINIGSFLPVPLWFGYSSSTSSKVAAEAKAAEVAAAAAAAVAASNPPPPPYTPRAEDLQDHQPIPPASNPVLGTQARSRSLRHHSSGNLASLLPSPPVPVSFADGDDAACDCGASYASTGSSHPVRHEPDCRSIHAAAAAEMAGDLRALTLRGLNKAAFLFWIPMMVAFLCLAIFRLVVTNEEMGEMVERIITMHVDVFKKTRKLAHWIKDDAHGRLDGWGAFF
ncbi:SPT3 Dosage dependent suppressor of Ty-induced promoter mutations-like protein [Irineochytrium annulatum]|nr:SPT3 Dosage dependent suppressor of Ty-induced promoter mutations-like protein [Irineochytrium annulatum]